MFASTHSRTAVARSLEDLYIDFELLCNHTAKQGEAFSNKYQFI